MIRRVGLIALLACAVAFPAVAQDKSAPAKEPAKTEPAKQPEAKPAPAADTLVYVKMSTSAGDIVIELNETKAPVTVKNFLGYVEKDFYAGTIFHRVMKDFMIQGGGMNKDFSQKKTEAPIKNEWKNGLKNAKYTIAMARTNVADSATSQFFINTNNNGMLDQPRDGAAYCVFGKVVEGTDTVDKIRNAPVVASAQGEQSKPVEPVEIKSVKRLSDKEVADWKAKSAAPAAPAAPAKKDEPKKEGK